MSSDTFASIAHTPPEPPASSSIGDALAQAVENRLQASAYLTLRRVHCLAVGGWVVLRGTVSSYYVKQMAQQVAAATPGVTSVTNELEVVRRML